MLVAGPKVRKLLETTRLIEAIPVFENVQTAVDGFE